MAHHANCRPEDNGKKPKKDGRKQQWMRDAFDSLRSGAEKERCGSEANQQRKFGAYDVAETLSTFRLLSWLCLCRHERENIESARVRQCR